VDCHCAFGRAPRPPSRAARRSQRQWLILRCGASLVWSEPQSLPRRPGNTLRAAGLFRSRKIIARRSRNVSGTHSFCVTFFEGREEIASPLEATQGNGPAPLIGAKLAPLGTTGLIFFGRPPGVLPTTGVSPAAVLNSTT